jgi:hypothetical protein
MKIFDLIGPGNSAQTCQQCIHFSNDPSLVEQAYPGLTTMSSGFASVRDRDGFCNHNELYLSARDNCACFTSHPAEVK